MSTSPRDRRALQSEEGRRSSGRHKDTRRWCKGVPGREHQVVTEIPAKWTWARKCGPATDHFGARSGMEGWLCSHAQVCTVCGKVLAYNFFSQRFPCPDRPTEEA